MASSSSSSSSSSESLKLINNVLNYVSLAGFAILFAFFVTQYRQKRCKWEVIFVVGTSFLFSGTYHIFGSHVPARFVIAGMEEGRSVPWARFAGYLVSCPVLLLHLSNLRGEANYDTFRAMQLVGLFQCVTLCGMTAAMCVEDTPKACFHLLGGCFAIVLFWRVRGLFVKALADFPEQARGHLYLLMFCFLGGWGGFGLTFHLGPEGWGLIDPALHDIIVRLLDILTKHVYASVGWSLRWRVLYPLAQMGVIQETSKGFVDHNKDAVRPKVLFVSSSAKSSAVVRFWQKRMLACGVDVVFKTTVSSALHEITSRNAEFAFTLADMELIRSEEVAFQMPAIRRTPLLAFCKNTENGKPTDLDAHEIDDAMFAPYSQVHVSNVTKYWIVHWYSRRREGLVATEDEKDDGHIAVAMNDVAPPPSQNMRGRGFWRSPSQTDLEMLMKSRRAEKDVKLDGVHVELNRNVPINGIAAPAPLQDPRNEDDEEKQDVSNESNESKKSSDSHRSKRSSVSFTEKLGSLLRFPTSA